MTSVYVDDVAKAHAQGPQEQGPFVTAVLDDTVGNLVRLSRPKG